MESVIITPTLDKNVREMLRRLSEPVSLFGEREWERRDRLRVIMADHPNAAADHEYVTESMSPRAGYEYPFYTEGTEQLVRARKCIARFSTREANKRLELERMNTDWNDNDNDNVCEMGSNWRLDVSENDARPLSGCSFSRNGELLGTCSFNGKGKVWRIVRPQQKLELNCVLEGHMGRTTDICFSGTDTAMVATASADCTAKLWSVVEQGSGELVTTFIGHTQRLARLAFHPSGRYLGTASYDETWRLWDVETSTELLQQEGHYRSVYGVDFHPDGSLAASTGMDCLARIWDLRTGRNIVNFEGHALPVTGVAFSPNGYHLATASEDNHCNVWDLRKRQSLYRIPAHSKLISQVRFEPGQGSYILTASHDRTCRVWSSRDFRLISTLSAHEDIVSASDISGDGELIASVAHDRTIKLWSKS